MFITVCSFACNAYRAFPAFYTPDDEKFEGPDLLEEQSVYLRSKPLKDRSPFTLLASSRFVRNRFLNSLTLPTKKLRSTSDPKGGGPKLGGMRRTRTVTEPALYPQGQGDVFSPVFNGSRLPQSPSVSQETSFVGGKTPEEPEPRLPRGGPGAGPGERSSRERLACDGSSSSGGGAQFKSRSQSFNTDTTTSGVSSMSSSPSREAVSGGGVGGSPGADTDCVSLNTVVSAKTVKTLYSLTPQSNHLPLSKSNSVSLVPPGSSHTLPRRAQSLKSPSVAAIKSLADCSFVYTSPRDALGYATLKRLQQQRIHPSLSHSEALASPAKDVLFTDTITMKTGSLDSRLTPRR